MVRVSELGGDRSQGRRFRPREPASELRRQPTARASAPPPFQTFSAAVAARGTPCGHACGFKLANDGTDTRSLQAYLGHKNIQHTVRYTELSPTRFKDFWKD
jgi:integrase